MSTPLYDELRELASRAPLRFDMPGHHGLPLPASGLLDPALDFTETGRTGDLFGPGGDAIERAEALWASALGFEDCLFLTGGSTQGVHAGLALLSGCGGGIALDRSSHRSAYNALALLDFTPRYLPRPWLDAQGVSGPVGPDEVERVLSAHPEVKTVGVVSPSYYGVLSDIPAIARVCHAHGAKLLVDAAHGAHLPFLGYEGFAAADAAVFSAHKTLPALGQSALLAANGFSMDELRRVGSIYGSSSPSYLMMACLDVSRDWMQHEGRSRYMRVCERCAALRERLPALRPAPGLSLDPARLTVKCGDGHALAGKLRAQDIFPEMADCNHVVFILTAADTPERLDALERSLTPLLAGSPPPEDFSALRPPAPPPAALSPREALFSPRKRVALSEAEGLVCARQAAPYPPGSPVVAPGERFTKKHLAYLEQIGYNEKDTEVVAEGRQR